MRKSSIFTFAILSLCVLLAVSASAQENKPKPIPYTLDFCPVMNSKLGDTPLTEVIDGREVKFCCPGCITMFKQDKAKYFKVIDDALIKKQKGAYPIKDCLVCGQALKEDIAKNQVVDGRLVRFCGTGHGCAAEFNKNPQKYFAKLDAASPPAVAAEGKSCCANDGACPKAKAESACPKAGACPKTQASAGEKSCPQNMANAEAAACPKASVGSGCPKAGACPKTQASAGEKSCPKDMACAKAAACPKASAESGCPKADACPKAQASSEAGGCSKDKSCATAASHTRSSAKSGCPRPSASVKACAECVGKPADQRCDKCKAMAQAKPSSRSCPDRRDHNGKRRSKTSSEKSLSFLDRVLQDVHLSLL